MLFDSSDFQKENDKKESETLSVKTIKNEETNIFSLQSILNNSQKSGNKFSNISNKTGNLRKRLLEIDYFSSRKTQHKRVKKNLTSEDLKYYFEEPILSNLTMISFNLKKDKRAHSQKHRKIFDNEIESLMKYSAQRKISFKRKNKFYLAYRKPKLKNFQLSNYSNSIEIYKRGFFKHVRSDKEIRTIV